MVLQIELNSELYLCCTLAQLFKSTSISHHSNPLRTSFHHHFGILHRKEKKHSHLLWSTIIHAFIHTETRFWQRPFHQHHEGHNGIDEFLADRRDYSVSLECSIAQHLVASLVLTDVSNDPDRVGNHSTEDGQAMDGFFLQTKETVIT